MGASESNRIRWLDAARGISIILVTVFHTVFVVEDALGYGVGAWPQLNAIFLPLRMPLFFLVSGLLAAGAVRKPLRDTRRRTLGLLYLYVLWSLIQLVHLVAHLRRDADPLPATYDVLANFLMPTGLWFLWALAGYFLLSRLLVTWLGERSWMAVFPLFALAMIAPVVDEYTSPYASAYFGDVFFGAFCQNFVWFYVALHLREEVFALVARATWSRAAIAVMAFAVLYVPLKALGIAHLAGWALSPLALVAALNILGLSGYRGVIGTILAAVGRRTLPIYVFQWIAMHALALMIVDHRVLQRFGDPDSVATVATPLLGAAIVGATWWLGGVVLRSPLSWLLEPPRWLVELRSSRTRARGI